MCLTHVNRSSFVPVRKFWLVVFMCTSQMYRDKRSPVSVSSATEFCMRPKYKAKCHCAVYVNFAKIHCGFFAVVSVSLDLYMQ